MADGTEYALPPGMGPNSGSGNPNASAGNKLAGVYGIPPAMGAQALTDSQTTGVHPDIALQAPQPVGQLATDAKNQSVINSSPPVRDFLNSTNDAHAAVVQKDLPGLAKVGWKTALFGADSFHSSFQPFQDIADSWNKQLQGLDQLNAKIGTDFKSGDVLTGVKDWASGIMGGIGLVPSALVAPITAPAARSFAAMSPVDPTANVPDIFKPLVKFGLSSAQAGPLAGVVGLEPVDLSTPEKRQGFFQNTLTNILLSSIPEAQRATIAEGLKGVGGVFGKGGKPSGGGGVPSVGVNPVTDTFRAATAEADAAKAADIQDTVAATQTHSISPATMEEFLRQQPSERTVSVNPEAIIQLQAEGHDPFPEHAREIAAAAQTGEDVELPLSRYLTRTAGQPFAEQLNNATVFREGGVSVDGAKELPQAQTEVKTPQAPDLQSLPDSLVGDITTNILNTGTDDAGGVRVTASPDEISALRNAGVEVDDNGNISPRSTLALMDERSYRNGGATRPQRTLAEDTRAEMEKVVKAQFLEPLFKDPAAIGMTKGQFERYNAQIEDHLANVSDRLLERAYEQIRRERTPEWANAVKQHAATVEQELARQPAIQARSYLTNGKGPLGEPIERPFKLNREDALSLYGKDLGLPDRMFSKTGVSPDEAAAVFGYPSGADMLRDLDQLNQLQGDRSIAEHMKEMVKAEAENRARAQLGFTVDPEEMYNEASRLVNGPKVTDFLATELQHLAEAAGLPFDKARVKAVAAERFAAKPVREALNLKKLEGFVYKGGVKAEKALLKGDAATAFIRKQQQFIHHLQLAEAHKFAKYWTKTQRQWNRVAKKVTMTGVSQDALNWSKEIVASTGRPVKGNTADLTRPINGFHDISQFIQAKNDAGADIPHAPIPFGVDAKDMQVGAYRGVADMVGAIMKWGREENQVTVAGEKRELREVLDEGIASLNRYTRTITDRELSDPTLLERIDSARRVVDSWLVRNEQLMRDFGARDPTSPFFQVVSRRLQERKGWSEDTRAGLAKHFHQLTTDVGKGFDRWLRAKLPSVGPHTDITTSDGSPLFNTNKDILMAALHMGDVEALDKFARGYGTTPEAIEAAVFANSTPRMWTAAQGIWDAFNGLRPEIEAMYRRITGVTPEMVSPRPFTTPDGLELKGGYFPVMYDAAKMPKDWVRQEDPTSMLGSPHYVRATPSNKYIEQRTGVAAPIQMDLNMVYSRINQVVHDLAYREVLADMNKFLLHPDMVDAIRHKYGPEYVAKLKDDIKSIAGSESVNPNDAKIGKALDYLTESQMINMIGFSLKTMAKHGLTAQFQAPSEVGVVRYLTSLQRVALQPLKYTRIAERESHDVRHVLSTINEDAFRQFQVLQQGKSGVTRTALSFAFHFVALSNKLVAVPLYDAAKLMIADKYPEMDAGGVQAAAGQIVRQALGSSGPTDAPAALRMGNSLWGRLGRLTNPFLTFLSHMYNKQREIPQAFGYAGEKPDVGRGLAVIFASIIVPIVVEQAIQKQTLKMGRNAAEFFGYWAEGLLHHEAGGVPIINSAVAVGAKHVFPDYPGGEGGLVQMADALGQTAGDVGGTVFHHKRWTDKKTQRALIAGGYVGRYPGVVAARVEGAVSKVLKGGENAMEAAHDFFLGAKRK